MLSDFQSKGLGLKLDESLSGPVYDVRAAVFYSIPHTPKQQLLVVKGAGHEGTFLRN